MKIIILLSQHSNLPLLPLARGTQHLRVQAKVNSRHGIIGMVGPAGVGRKTYLVRDEGHRVPKEQDIVTHTQYLERDEGLRVPKEQDILAVRLIKLVSSVSHV